jgi:hypothetical protein
MTADPPKRLGASVAQVSARLPRARSIGSRTITIKISEADLRAYLDSRANVLAPASFERTTGDAR